MSITPIIVAFLSIIVPGFFLAFALLRKTKLNLFEITVIGFIFGMIFPPALTWAESYLIQYVHAFTFSAALYNANVLILTVLGIVLCIQQGVLGRDTLKSISDAFSSNSGKPSRVSLSADYKQRVSELRARIRALGRDVNIIKLHQKEEEDLIEKHAREMQELKDKGAGSEQTMAMQELHAKEERRLYEAHEAEENSLIREDSSINQSKTQAGFSFKAGWIYPLIILILMLLTFWSRIANLSVAPTFFEFDPYFDMQSTTYILTFGYQILHDHSAWPVLAAGSNHRVQPIIPYLEAYWYELSTSNTTSLNHTLLSIVSSFYPAITAALLVFVIYLMIKYLYSEKIGIIGALLATGMPVLISTFIAGEQLLEPWGLFSLFFFFAAYLLAVNFPKEKRFAVLAGIAFVSTFLGAHYYTVDAGILALYILLQGIILVLKKAAERNGYNPLEILLLMVVGVPMALVVVLVGGPSSFAAVTILIAAMIAIGVAKASKPNVEEPKDRESSLDTISFYKINAIVIAIIAIAYIIYSPYNTSATNLIPSLFGIPIIVSLPLAALVLVVIFDYLPPLLKRFNVIKHVTPQTYIIFLLIAAVVLPLLILATPIGKPIKSYIDVSKKFTTPSSPLFMTVQEYTPTGVNYNFGGSIFGFIGNSLSVSSTSSFAVLVWLVLILFVIFMAVELYMRESPSSIFMITIVGALAIAGMSEVKYVPHFGVAYILAICVVVASIAAILQDLYRKTPSDMLRYLSVGFIAFAFIVSAAEASYIGGSFAAAGLNQQYGNTQACNILAAQITNQTAKHTGGLLGPNVVGYNQFCNQINNAQGPGWIAATAWMRSNVGPFAPRILAWWDYGDWINWFGNSNAVIRGDNAVAALDYKTAAQFVLGSQEGFGPSNLSKFMTPLQAKYVLFDNELVNKWGALDFLACIDTNQTTEAAAYAAAKQKNQSGFLIGQSPCELEHDPAQFYIEVSSSISSYCSFSNSSFTALQSFLVIPDQQQTPQYCASTTPNANGVYNVYTENGTKTNIVLSSSFNLGTYNAGGGTYLVAFMPIYLPNGPNDTITDAPTMFYDSNYYRGFFLGNMPGFTLAYPQNFTGVNFVNSTAPIMIYAIDNYTGGNPPTTPKPPWVDNNFSVPG